MNTFDTKKGRFYVAYGCFLLSGLIFSLIGIMSFIPMSTGAAGGIGLMFLVPLSMVAAGSICCGLVLSYLLRPHTPLLILSVVSLVFIAEVIYEAGSAFVYNLITIIYAIISIGVPLWWLSCKRNEVVDC